MRGAILVDEHGRTNLPDVYAAGERRPVDGRLRRPVTLAGPANRAGRGIADHILRPASVPFHLGTAIVRVGELTAALTGANGLALRAAGIEAQYPPPAPHPARRILPGATQMAPSMSATATAFLLGAQPSALRAWTRGSTRPPRRSGQDSPPPTSSTWTSPTPPSTAVRRIR